MPFPVWNNTLHIYLTSKNHRNPQFPLNRRSWFVRLTSLADWECRVLSNSLIRDNNIPEEFPSENGERLSAAADGRRRPKLRDSHPDLVGPGTASASARTSREHVAMSKRNSVVGGLDNVAESNHSLELLPKLTEAIAGLQGELEKPTNEAQENKETLMKFVACLKEVCNELPSIEAKNQATMAKLKAELKNAWSAVEAERERDISQQSMLDKMRDELASLKEALAHSNAKETHNTPSPVMFQIAQEEKIQSLDNEELGCKLARMEEHSKSMAYENEELQAKLNNMQSEKNSLDIELQALKEIITTKKSEMDREMRNKEKLETSLKATNEVLTRKENEIQTKIIEMKQLKDQVLLYENLLRDEKGKSDKLEQEKDSVTNKVARLQQDYEEQVLTVTRLLTEGQDQQIELKRLEEVLQQAKEESRTLSRHRDTLSKKYKALDEAKIEIEVERDKLRQTNGTLLKQNDDLKRELEHASRQIDAACRERDLAQKNFVKATGQTQKQINLVKMTDQSKKNLEQEIAGYKEEAAKMRKLIFTLEKERDRLLFDVNKLDGERNDQEENIRMLQISCSDSKKKLADLEKKLREQESMYEGVRADRNLYSKNLIEAQDEASELRMKIKLMDHQLDQLKDEITSKNAELRRAQFEHSKLEKDKESLFLQIGKLQQSLEESNRLIKTQQTEEHKLRHVIEDGDAVRVKLEKDYNAVVQERDIIGTQLIRRNDEISLLYEKIRIQTSALNKGEIQYRERLEDIRVLKLEIKRLRREKTVLQSETQNVEGLKNEIFRLQKETLQERTKVKVLEEELESPMNVHRWRKLAGSDPSTFELIKKVQMLQKRLIAKTEDVVEKELIIAQKEKLHNELKKLITRQPGPEVVEELRNVKEAVKVKVRESKALASELNMYHSQINQYKFEIEKLTREQQELKKKYYEARKKSNKQQKLMLGATVDLQKIPRFMGGGYRMPDKTNQPHFEQTIETL